MSLKPGARSRFLICGSCHLCVRRSKGRNRQSFPENNWKFNFELSENLKLTFCARVVGCIGTVVEVVGPWVRHHRLRHRRRCSEVGRRANCKPSSNVTGIGLTGFHHNPITNLLIILKAERIFIGSLSKRLILIFYRTLGAITLTGSMHSLSFDRVECKRLWIRFSMCRNWQEKVLLRVEYVYGWVTRRTVQ